MCVNYDLCFRCYAGRAVIHTDHEFREIGDEFVEEEEKQSDKVSTSDASSSDGDSSDDDSDDD